MSSDKTDACADMILADAMEDMAEYEKISIEEARDRIISCGAYDCMYSYDNGLWKEGPDYFQSFVTEMERRNHRP